MCLIFKKIYSFKRTGLEGDGEKKDLVLVASEASDSGAIPIFVWASSIN